MRWNKAYAYWVFGIGLILIDRLTKYWAITGKLSLTHCTYIQTAVLFNRGISWGIFNTACPSVSFFISLMILIIISILAWYTYTLYKSNTAVIAPILILAGACSNFIDRICYHAVIDFILISVAGYVFPIFNVADVFIVIGAFFMFLQGVKSAQ